MMGDGGPAFPTDSEQQVGPKTYHFEGMSLRDWFAGQALPALIVHLDFAPADTAKEAYLLADAMLAEREKEPSDG